MYDLIIVGGGPSALAAATYTLGKQLNFLMVYQSIGGKAGARQQLSGAIEEEYLAGAEAVRAFERQITRQEGRALRDRVLAISKVSGVFRVETEHHGVQECEAVIVATGATPIMLDVPGARELLGQGLGYSVTTHTHLMSDKIVAVIGTTVRALRGVAELAQTAQQVYLIAPDATGLMTPLAKALRGRSNVQFFEGYAVQEVIGPFSVERLVVVRDDHTQALDVDAAFVDLGLLPNSGIVRQIVQTDPDGFIWVDDRNATSLPGMFAAGDVTTAFGEQVLIAIGDGARAALSAYDYLLV